MTRRTRRLARRSGWTLIELVIVLVIFSIVLAAVFQQMLLQRRAAAVGIDTAASHGRMRQALSMLSMDVRAISTGGADIYARSDSMVELRSTFGSSIACAVAAPSTLVLPPRQLARNVLTTWLHAPVAGDTVLVFDDSTSVNEADWKPYAIVSIDSVAGACPVASGFVQAAEAVLPAYVVTLDPGRPLSPTILTGAPVRLVRRVHYERYRGADGAAYLGYYDCVASRTPACGSLEPVAGPFGPATDPLGGSEPALFTFQDSTGAVLPAPAAGSAPSVASANVAGVDVLLRTRRRSLAGTSGFVRETQVDSLASFIAVRNRP